MRKALRSAVEDLVADIAQDFPGRDADTLVASALQKQVVYLAICDNIRTNLEEDTPHA